TLGSTPVTLAVVCTSGSTTTTSSSSSWSSSFPPSGTTSTSSFSPISFQWPSRDTSQRVISPPYHARSELIYLDREWRRLNNEPAIQNL
ncbi:hypothetical protein TARUN_6546, partial [Trichoderma arundinaceum]